jgi:hypothetical protein
MVLALIGLDDGADVTNPDVNPELRSAGVNVAPLFEDIEDHLNNEISKRCVNTALSFMYAPRTLV